MEIQQDKQQKHKIFKDSQDFIQKQKQWLDLEQQEEIESHKKLLEENSPHDLQQLGMAIVKMKCKSIKQGLYGRILLTFTHPNYNEKVHTSEQFAKQVKLPEVKIQAGDNIAVYKAMDGFLSKKPVVSGIVYRKNQYKIVLSLEDFKNNVDEFFDKNYVNHNEIYSIVIEVNEITYNRQMSTLQLLEEVQQDVNSKQRHLCDILFESNNSSDLNKLNPHVKRSQILKYDPQNDKNSQQINWRKKDLNDEQKDAIKFCLSRENIGLIHGPPGTGKTMTVCELIYQAAKSGLKVLACSGSNIAVDNMVERIAGTDLKIVRIGHPARLLNSIKDKCLDAQIRKTSSYKILKDLKKDQQKLLKKIQKASTYQEKKALKSENFNLNKEIKIQERQALKEVAEDSQIICCTNTGAGDKIFKYELKNTIFDLVVIDEAAQSMEISCWLPILKGKRVILAGDHKQLPPTVKSNNKNLSLTLFDRVLKDFEGAEIGFMKGKKNLEKINLVLEQYKGYQQSIEGFEKQYQLKIQKMQTFMDNFMQDFIYPSPKNGKNLVPASFKIDRMFKYYKQQEGIDAKLVSISKHIYTLVEL
ncbi:P-loop containing nucleoside triphosphate hydrolase [Pseudocohnilembus persalinus]|uniref:DNA helicase n=1 Tax=Pseudocohnilembus persalinus TaxID=266149 RepID=A0A0V0R6Y9_PSEPJ|nr:P-loop containing nucleoside triphosphate hydrolase [Pseudocohnilembus persalinus]|eukprot:KRX10128.1 P-loop containing nucleoside triphosphate hydrolase [Pseudocohnilembus persalinus]